METKNKLSRLLPAGGVSAIAKELGLAPGTASAAIRRGNPGHPAVLMALKMAKESGALEAAQTLATLKAA